MKEEQGLEPSRLDPGRFNLRNKGLKSASGKLHKGCVKDAFSKLSIGSIPSNYESIIYRCEEKRGFGTGQKRFNPGSSGSELTRSDFQSQLERQAASPVQKVHASHSSKGYGPLIAKQKRWWHKYGHYLGPGKYFDEKKGLENQPIQKKKRHCYNLQRQDFKRKELTLNKENQVSPGPGYYDVYDKNQYALTGWKSSFATKDTRDGYIAKNTNPGPGCYSGQNSPKKRERKDEKKDEKKEKDLRKYEKGDENNGKLKINERREFQEEELFHKLALEKQNIGKHYLPRRKGPDQPGPGSYDHDLPNFKPLYERIKISHNFIQSQKDRFNDPTEPKTKDSQSKGPTACTYDLPSTFDKEKKLIQMSSFMSQSKRVVFQGGSTSSKLFYDAIKDEDRNFHFNITGKWV